MNNNEKIIEIIKSRRLDLNLSLSEVARRVGIPKSTLSRYESLQRQFPLNQISTIASVLELHPEDILGITSKTITETHNSTILSEINKISSKLEEPRQQVVLDTASSQLEEQEQEENKVININQPQEDAETETLVVHGLESAGCGCWQEDDVDIEVQIPTKEIPTDFDDLAMVVGDSMRPYLHNADILFIKFTPQIEIGQIGVFRTSRGNFVKKLQQGYLESLNPDYDNIYFSENEECEMIGVVVNYYRK